MQNVFLCQNICFINMLLCKNVLVMTGCHVLYLLLTRPLGSVQVTSGGLTYFTGTVRYHSIIDLQLQSVSFASLFPFLFKIKPYRLGIRYVLMFM